MNSVLRRIFPAMSIDFFLKRRPLFSWTSHGEKLGRSTLSWRSPWWIIQVPCIVTLRFWTWIRYLLIRNLRSFKCCAWAMHSYLILTSFPNFCWSGLFPAQISVLTDFLCSQWWTILRLLLPVDLNLMTGSLSLPVSFPITWLVLFHCSDFSDHMTGSFSLPVIFPITDWQSFTASDFSELNVNPLPPDPQFGWLGWLVNQKFQLLVRARTSTSYSSPLGFPNLVDLSTTISIIDKYHTSA